MTKKRFIEVLEEYYPECISLIIQEYNSNEIKYMKLDENEIRKIWTPNTGKRIMEAIDKIMIKRSMKLN